MLNIEVCVCVCVWGGGGEGKGGGGAPYTAASRQRHFASEETKSKLQC